MLRCIRHDSIANSAELVQQYLPELEDQLHSSTTVKEKGTFLFLLFRLQGTLPLKELTICNLQQNCNHSQPQEFAFQINGTFSRDTRGCSRSCLECFQSSHRDFGCLCQAFFSHTYCNRLIQADVYTTLDFEGGKLNERVFAPSSDIIHGLFVAILALCCRSKNTSPAHQLQI